MQATLTAIKWKYSHQLYENLPEDGKQTLFEYTKEYATVCKTFFKQIYKASF